MNRSERKLRLIEELAHFANLSPFYVTYDDSYRLTSVDVLIGIRPTQENPDPRRNTATHASEGLNRRQTVVFEKLTLREKTLIGEIATGIARKTNLVVPKLLTERKYRDQIQGILTYRFKF